MILEAVYVLALLVIILWLRPNDKLKRLYWIGIFLKISYGLLLGYVYLIHLESGDTLVYHTRATELLGISSESFLEYLSVLFTANYPVFMAEARNELFIKIASVFYLFNNGNYWLTASTFSLLSFGSSWILIKKIRQHYPGHTLASAFAFLLFPSVAFWSSGMLKDSLVFMCMCYLASIIIEQANHEKTSTLKILLTFLALLLLFYLKFYLFAVIVFAMSAQMLFEYTHLLIRSKLNRLLVLVIGAILLGVLVSYSNFNLRPGNLPQAIYDNHTSYGTSADFQFDQLAPSYLSLALHSPSALLTGLLRPFPWEANAWWQWMTFEGLIILVLAGINLVYYRKWHWSPLIIIGLFCTLSLITFLALSTPNFGSLIRYRSIAMPFLTYILLIIPSKLFLSKA
ncbi:MAG: hypothetical protein JXR10_05570 [Cyclobacteriaceae bacterium]